MSSRQTACKIYSQPLRDLSPRGYALALLIVNLFSHQFVLNFLFSLQSAALHADTDDMGKLG